ncbi:MAG: Jag N-terminal domain-containing protein [Acidimicrobiales bacterium]
MEWVETTASTVEEAKELLLDQLGVDESDTEFDVLEVPKPGLFGRTKGQARVRARVKPKTPPSRDDRRRRPAKSKGGDAAAAAPAADDAGDTKDAPKEAAAPKQRQERAPREDRPRREERAPREDLGPRLDSEIAKQESSAFLTGLLDSFGTAATVEITIDEDGDLSAEINGENLGRLIGPRGGVISAIEELTRTRLQHVASGGSTPRFKLDVGGYRASRRPNLELLVDDVVEQVRSTGRPHVLDVVLAGERKLVHDRVAETAPDLRTHSEGEDPVRRVVLSPN